MTCQRDTADTGGAHLRPAPDAAGGITEPSPTEESGARNEAMLEAWRECGPASPAGPLRRSPISLGDCGGTTFDGAHFDPRNELTQGVPTRPLPGEQLFDRSLPE
jgi:hypothetical protein